jgi:HD-like signal output (HDOD) protein
MAADELREQIYRMQDLPTLPIVAQQIMSAADREDDSLWTLARIVEQDPSLTVKLLGLANAAIYGQQAQVSTVNRAITVVGTEKLRRLALCAFINTAWGHDAEREHFWKHSIAVAFGAAFQAQQFNVVSPDDAFSAGLLHDIGILVLDTVRPERYQKVERALQGLGSDAREAVERDLLGVDHAVAGGWLADRWQLPALRAEAIRGHHSSSDGSIPRMIRVAEQAALNSELGLSGEVDGPVPDHLAVESYLRSKADEIDEFFRITSEKAA